MGKIVGGVFAGVGAGVQYAGYRAQGRAQREINEFNAQVNDIKASDAEMRGRIAEQRLKLSSKKLIGASRAAFAAGGAVVGDDPDSTASNVAGDIAMLTENDALTIRANAAREAWGYRMGAADDRFRGKMAEYEGKVRAISAVLAAASSGSSGGFDSGGWNKSGGTISGSEAKGGWTDAGTGEVSTVGVA